jgi:hypothetical protein
VLLVRDEVFSEDKALMERYLVCDNCGARDILRLKRAINDETRW